MNGEPSSRLLAHATAYECDPLTTGVTGLIHVYANRKNREKGFYEEKIEIREIFAHFQELLEFLQFTSILLSTLSRFP